MRHVRVICVCGVRSCHVVLVLRGVGGVRCCIVVGVVLLLLVFVIVVGSGIGIDSVIVIVMV